MKRVEIVKNVYYIGCNDRKKERFENNWPIPNGVSYNSYLITTEHPTLIDTVEFGSDSNYLNRIEEILCGRELEYLVVNHLEPDHASMIGMVIAKYPKIKIIGNNQTARILANYYSVPAENFVTIKDGESLNIGEYTLTFALVPWVHWPETMVTYLNEEKILFSCDAFGGFGALNGSIFDGDNNFEEDYLEEMSRYYANIVGKYSGMVQKAFAKLEGLDIKIIAPSHGLVWRDNPAKVLEVYQKWATYKSEKGVVIAFASMYGNTEQIADYIGAKLGEKGIRVKCYDVSKVDVSYIIKDIWNFKALILGTCAYNTQMHPMMEHLCNEIKLVAPKEKIVSLFGSSSWNGAGVKALNKFIEEIGYTPIAPAVEVSGAPTIDKIKEATELLVNSIIEKL